LSTDFHYTIHEDQIQNTCNNTNLLGICRQLAGMPRDQNIPTVNVRVGAIGMAEDAMRTLEKYLSFFQDPVSVYRV